ncbi:hypothetical protein OK016_20825 [Vibrio chagasii]|nr:hypothetical protein [Vibrio chagasii]
MGRLLFPNSFLCGLFGLAFWDVIFSDVEGAFINRYQHRPLDLYHSDFQQKRELQINAVFQTISNQGIEHLLDVYDEKLGIANPFVHWNHFLKHSIDIASARYHGPCLIDLFKVMMSDLKLFGAR